LEVLDLDFTDAISCTPAGSFASDLAVVNAARISFDHEHDKMTYDDQKLIDYLLKGRHGSPFEHGYFKFKVEAPIFTFREHHRHRAGHSYNEMSGRYTELEPKFYVPAKARVQEGKPGHYIYVMQDEDAPMSVHLRQELAHAYTQAWDSYQHLLEFGIAKEQARMVLPVGIFTKMIWSCNPRSLMHFLSLRAEKHAQQEIQTVAYAAEAHFKEIMPITYQAFVKNGRIAP
jgi:thymidylate synthase (FAD)